MTARRAEIVGAGFAGLTAACALAQRGWQVRVHERSEALRTAGAGIYIYENGLRVLQAIGACDAAIAGALPAHTREVRDEANRVVAVHRWSGSRVFSVVRQNVINALAGAATAAGARIVTGATAVAASADGGLTLASGERLAADLIVGADGSNSAVRRSLGMAMKRTPLADGCTRLLLPALPQEVTGGGAGTTVEYWSGTRRVLYTPCSTSDIYVALTMLDDDTAAKAVPVRKELWQAAFPHLGAVIDRIGDRGRYDRFEMISLTRWSQGRVAIVGDAAHALPPNIGQGGGCAMMNALALAVHLERCRDVPEALRAWERVERPLTDHTQRISYLLGLPTTWPPVLRTLAFGLAGRSRWLTRQRTRTALHRPTGT